MAQGSEAERLAAEKQCFDAVLDSISDGVLVCDSAMHVTKFNTAAEQINGWTRADAIGAPCPDIFHGRQRRGGGQAALPSPSPDVTLCSRHSG